MLCWCQRVLHLTWECTHIHSMAEVSSQTSTMSPSSSTLTLGCLIPLFHVSSLFMLCHHSTRPATPLSPHLRVRKRNYRMKFNPINDFHFTSKWQSFSLHPPQKLKRLLHTMHTQQREEEQRKKMKKNSLENRKELQRKWISGNCCLRLEWGGTSDTEQLKIHKTQFSH